MSTPMAIANHFLLAMPSLNDIIFSHSLIYICEHHERGSVGMIVNRPTGHPATVIFNQLGITPKITDKPPIPLLFGGPIQADRGFVIHRPQGQWQSSLALIPDAVTITTSNDIIRAIAEGTGPKDMIIVMGYVAWEKGELERELAKENAWMICPFQPQLLFDVPFANRWKAAAETIGVNMDQLSGSGHA